MRQDLAHPEPYLGNVDQLECSQLSKASGAVDVISADGLQNFLAFCRLPRLLYAGKEGFASPLDADRWGLFSQRLNPHLKNIRSQFWLARRNGKFAGRIFAQIYDEFSAPHDASRAQFGCLDAIDDEKVVGSLTRVAEDWLRSRGASHVQGPFSPSINSESGLLIHGFTEIPMIALPWHPPYLGRLIEEQGYAKVRDLISYRYDVGERDRQAGPEIIARPEWRKRLNIRAVNVRYLKEEAEVIVDIFNDSWSGNWGFVPFTLEEFGATATAIKLASPGKNKFMQGGFMIELDGLPQAFALVLPNLHEIMADLDGRLFPFGLPRLVRRIRSHPYLSGRLALFGIRRALHRTAAGGAVILAFIAELRRRGVATPIRQVEFGWVLENNFGIRRAIELSGGRVYKVHRIYEKSLAA